MHKTMMGLSVLAMLFVFASCGQSDSYIRKAMEEIEALDYDAALTSLQSAEDEGENARLVARARGIAYMGKTSYEEAVEEFKKSLSLSNGFVQPIDYDINYYMGAALVKLGRYEEAEDAYTAIIDLDDQEEAYYLRGMVRLKRSEYSEAMTDFDRCIKDDPENYTRMLDIYNALAENGYREAGVEYLGKAIDDGGAKVSALDRGRMYFYMGEYQKAANALEEARRDSGDADSSLYLGRSYEAVGEYNYAKTVYEQYLTTGDANAAIYNQLGLCDLAMGEYHKALEAFDAGMQTGDTSLMQSLSYNEIVAYEYLGDFTSAAALMENYVKNYPEDEAALREQQFLATR